MKDLATKNTKDTKKVWPKVRLGDVCEFRRGLTYSKGDEAELSSNVVLRSNNVSLETGKLDFTELKYLKETFVIPADKKVVQSSLLMCMANGSKPHLGKVALIDKDYGYAFGGFMGLLVPNDIDQKYLYLALTSAQFKSRIKSLQDGANINNLKFADIADFQFPLPPLSVQRAIVARLEKELGEADKLAAKFKRVAELADNAFKAELDETFKALEDNSRRDAETRRVRLGDICERIIDCPHTTAPDEGAGIPLVRTPNVGLGRLVYANMHRVSEAVYMERVKRGIPQCGDLIFAREAPAGNVAVIQPGEKVCLGQRTVLLKPGDKINSEWLAYYILSPASQERLLTISSGSTVTHVNVCDIKRFGVTIVPLSTQRAIVAKLDASKERCEKLKAAAMRGHAAAENLRKAILAEAFEQ